MAAGKNLRKTVEQLTRSIRETVEESAGKSAVGAANVTARSNTVVATNVGSEGSTRSATSTQINRIRQSDGETVEETYTHEVKGN